MGRNKVTSREGPPFVPPSSPVLRPGDNSFRNAVSAASLPCQVASPSKEDEESRLPYHTRSIIRVYETLSARSFTAFHGPRFDDTDGRSLRARCPLCVLRYVIGRSRRDESIFPTARHGFCLISCDGERFAQSSCPSDESSGFVSVARIASRSRRFERLDRLEIRASHLSKQ